MTYRCRLTFSFGLSSLRSSTSVMTFFIIIFFQVQNNSLITQLCCESEFCGLAVDASHHTVLKVTASHQKCSGFD